MRAFIVLAVISAARADTGGYNYGIGSSSFGSVGSIDGGSLGGGSSLDSISYSVGSQGGVSIGGGSHIGSLAGIGGSLSGSSFGSGSLGSGSLGSSSLGGGLLGGGSLGVGSPGGSSLAGGSLGGGSIGSSYQGPAPVNNEFLKEFFTYSAPEGDFDDNGNVGDVTQSLKKNLRVIFIRAPENKGLENAAVALAKQAGEQQTAIYVLTKQGDISNLANKLQNLNRHSSSKPEVHFVKYRTSEDAANAQRTIQAEYERLGGHTASHNGGVAPVLDFASKSPAAVAAPGLQTVSSSNGGGGTNGFGISGSNNIGGIQNPSNAYIPPSAPRSTYLPVAKVK